MPRIVAVSGSPEDALQRRMSINQLIQERSDFVQAIKAIYDGVSFVPKQPIPVQGKCEVIITFLKPTESKTRPEESIDCIEKLCGSLADYPVMSIDKF